MRRISIAIVALGSLGLAACGGSSSKSGSDTPTTPAGKTTTSATAGGPVTQAIDKDAWFAGFKLTLGTGTFNPDPSPTVEIATTFENLGTASARFDGSLVLATAGNSITSTDLTDIPDVPGGTKGKGTIKFDVAPAFKFADAALTIGASDHNQATVPLGREGTLVSLEPVPVTVKGTATAGQLKIVAHDGELRADIPSNHSEIEKKQLALTIDFDATNRGTGGDGYAFVAENLALTLPDGTTVAPDKAPIELLGHQATTKNLAVRFLVDDPAAGKYAFVVREGESRGKLNFTIKPTAGAGTTSTTTCGQVCP